MGWYRRYSGTVADPKFTVIARRSGQPRVLAIAVWDYILELAAERNADGRFKLCVEAASLLLEVEEQQIEAILGVMEQRGMIVDGRVTGWLENYVRYRPVNRIEILERDGYRCTYCGDDSGPFEIDHVIPRSRGGTNEPENLTVACRTCNQSKRAKNLDEWRGWVQ